MSHSQLVRTRREKGRAAKVQAGLAKRAKKLTNVAPAAAKASPAAKASAAA